MDNEPPTLELGGWDEVKWLKENDFYLLYYDGTW